ncbi:hypothetical protein FSP39_011483 [Pinctada imbricata]|uniref:Uncharacterized protein n=1 Tax=Pinctada imbricata TaxID=66713 RepID=A0AA88XF58_PINIB|nr:hypothetical protein FSP39_011483 [Pinctada imbricata]
MDTLKKIPLPWKAGKRYNLFKGKENTYFHTPNPKVRTETEATRRTKNQNQGEGNGFLRRNTSLTRSVRDAVGTIRQRIRSSTKRRVRLKDGISSPATAKVTKKTKRTATGSTPHNTRTYRDIKMYSPFQIETPKQMTGIRTSARPRIVDNMETPTRLRREVESLTQNMQALATLTPNTLEQRVRTRRMSKSPLTNGSLQVSHGTRVSHRLQAKRRIDTFMY